jgi:hypothetical protein
MAYKGIVILQVQDENNFDVWHDSDGSHRLAHALRMNIRDLDHKRS